MRKNREIRKKMLFYVIFSARSNQAFDKTRDSIFASVGGANCYRTVRRGIKRIKSFLIIWIRMISSGGFYQIKKSIFFGILFFLKSSFLKMLKQLHFLNFLEMLEFGNPKSWSIPIIYYCDKYWRKYSRQSKSDGKNYW